MYKTTLNYDLNKKSHKERNVLKCAYYLSDMFNKGNKMLLQEYFGVQYLECYPSRRLNHSLMYLMLSYFDGNTYFLFFIV